MSFASSPLADGTVETVIPSGINGIDQSNQLCGVSTSSNPAWLLAPITNIAAGLPATIVPPLTLV
jgi:hypothetical protein